MEILNCQHFRVTNPCWIAKWERSAVKSRQKHTSKLAVRDRLAVCLRKTPASVGSPTPDPVTTTLVCRHLCGLWKPHRSLLFQRHIRGKGFQTDAHIVHPYQLSRLAKKMSQISQYLFNPPSARQQRRVWKGSTHAYAEWCIVILELMIAICFVVLGLVGCWRSRLSQKRGFLLVRNGTTRGPINALSSRFVNITAGNLQPWDRAFRYTTTG